MYVSHLHFCVLELRSSLWLAPLAHVYGTCKLQPVAVIMWVLWSWKDRPKSTVAAVQQTWIDFCHYETIHALL